LKFDCDKIEFERISIEVIEIRLSAIKVITIKSKWFQTEKSYTIMNAKI